MVLETFDAKLNVVKDSSDSLLALIGQAISPIFKPLGFADWRVTTSLISGFTAKEAVVSTMAVLMNTSTANLGTALSGAFSTLSALELSRIHPALHPMCCGGGDHKERA